MRVLILGSGVIGVSSAWHLARLGHEVCVIDRQPTAAMETSFANAGQVSVAYSAPWAAPGVPLKALRWLFQRHAPLAIYPDGSLFQWQWLLSLLMQCTHRRYEVNKARLVGLARYSQQCLHRLASETGIAYEGRRLGTLQLFRTEKQMLQAEKDMAILRRYGFDFSLLDASGCIDKEPALKPQIAKIAGGLHLPHDETGDCRMFTARLTELAQQAGVEFLFGHTVQAFRQEKSGRLSGAVVNGEILTADAYVVAAASHSRTLLRPLGISLPVYPIKGYSLTVPIANPDAAPLSTVMDETCKVALTRFEQRIRVGGIAELSGYNPKLRPHRLETLSKVLRDWFPDAGQPDSSSFWCGLRPMTADGMPIIGATQIPNLWLNTGHGTLGWTLCCGSGALLADLINGTESTRSSISSNLQAAGLLCSDVGLANLHDGHG